MHEKISNALVAQRQSRCLLNIGSRFQNSPGAQKFLNNSILSYQQSCFYDSLPVVLIIMTTENISLPTVNKYLPPELISSIKLREIAMLYMIKNIDKPLWHQKQSNEMDFLTKYIYKLHTYNDVIKYFSNSEQNVIDYAVNRWYNYISSSIQEDIFSVFGAERNTTKEKFDVFINKEKVDLKGTVFPKNMGRNQMEYSWENKSYLINWMYKNQSKGQRFGLGCRLFLVFCDIGKFEHWKIKASPNEMYKSIKYYMINKCFSEVKPILLDDGTTVLADVIFIKGDSTKLFK